MMTDLPEFVHLVLIRDRERTLKRIDSIWYDESLAEQRAKELDLPEEGFITISSNRMADT